MKIQATILISIICFIAGILIQNASGLSCIYGQAPSSNGCNTCGGTSQTPNIKIVGGTIAAPNSWPSQVFILQTFQGIYRFGNNGNALVTAQFWCGATLISGNTIMTAASCIIKQTKVSAFGQTWIVNIAPNNYYPTWQSMFRVYLGGNDLSFLSVFPYTKPANVQISSVSQIIQHPSFNSVNFLNDIALMKLSSNFAQTQFIRYACLPDQSFANVAYQTGYTAGWGRQSTYSTALPTFLYNVKLSIYAPDSCKNTAPSVQKNWLVQICAGDLTGQKGICFGDGGNGLFIFDSSNRHVVVGITSYMDASGCAQSGRPSVFTKVSAFVNWIQSYW